MTGTALEFLEFELPEGWNQLERPGSGLFTAVGPADDAPGEGFQSSLIADIYADLEGEDAHRDFHIAQVESLARTMTDALLIDDADVEVAGLSAITSTIAFRQGFWTVTARIWTIDAPGGAVMITTLCDVDRTPIEGPIFDDVVQSIVITGSKDSDA